jgi:beta-fructofuranosidase
MATFFRPGTDGAADFIPFYWDGAYHLFYLWSDRSGNAPEGTPWEHLVTRDFLSFDEWPRTLTPGGINEQDLHDFTGSVIEREGLFYAFYTGHNHHLIERGQPQQVILLATSPDLREWTRDPRFHLPAPVAAGDERDDWRDPFVCWNAEAGEYWMLVAGRRPNAAPPRRHGVTALLTSQDLRAWELREPLWAPEEFFTHECPDLFKIGAWWYLVFSEFSDRFATRYRMARSPRGPWLAPAEDACDARAWYAAKSASDGTRRFLCGWLADREGQSDEGGWQWGGNLVAHELLQRPNGTLGVRPPEAVVAAFATALPLTPQPVLGPWQVSTNGIAVDSTARFSVLTLGAMPGECLLEAQVAFQTGTAALGLVLRAADTLEEYFQLRLEPARQRMVIDRWPRPGDVPFLLERPLALEPGHPVQLRVFTEGSCLVAYANDVALSCRMYGRAEGLAGLFVAEGTASFHEVKIKGR